MLCRLLDKLKFIKIPGHMPILAPTCIALGLCRVLTTLCLNLCGAMFSIGTVLPVILSVDISEWQNLHIIVAIFLLSVRSLMSKHLYVWEYCILNSRLDSYSLKKLSSSLCIKELSSLCILFIFMIVLENN